ncbi:peptidylprolyl isomerase [Erythrobacteraceae bacterium CFH 75059]|uniref:peptidylprolyl isomerase n=1 Tax=Qipengyuania thermophila TaxID=2509361 RepID=UPI00101EBC0D|nr:peptidylprolyl isomerase [Qipengyuania thermophila]TCD06277.1 peptidylprolyl isomerase [Erythrobacteraceae bacterium CFH 75059]
MLKPAFLFVAAVVATSGAAREQDRRSPNEIVAAAPASDWVAIAPSDLLVMTLAPDAGGKPRQVVIQLMPPPFSQGWVENIRTLARAGWYDGLSVNRVQDNYVAQWGDPDGEDAAKAKKLPAGLRVMDRADYAHQLNAIAVLMNPCGDRSKVRSVWLCDPYAPGASFRRGWPVSTDGAREWPVHCYGMVGVGRGMPPDTGSGAELYAVIGHAPRHLDRNIALVGRVVEGIEHLSSLPRGTEALGFYKTPQERVPIVSIRLARDLPEADPASSSEAAGQQTRPRFQYLSTESATFAAYADARANRRDPFFIQPAGGADVCNIPVPVRRLPAP